MNTTKLVHQVHDRACNSAAAVPIVRRALARQDARMRQTIFCQDGVWNGERILPEGYVKFVSTPAPAWVADKLPIYGGFFWINGLGQYPVPRNSYYTAGAGGQTTMIVPSRDLVVVRLGHYKGEAIGTVAFRNALTR